ncbi:hypothetical protein AB4Z52_33820 [Rhizobium sp. 2YAF20]|uniref:hypothetical protein n=1 Tax=Rhizobium sp. 2YAF20 TaxID=3233027 RepID=UPI003F9D8C23
MSRPTLPPYLPEHSADFDLNLILSSCGFFYEVTHSQKRGTTGYTHQQIKPPCPQPDWVHAGNRNLNRVKGLLKDADLRALFHR